MWRLGLLSLFLGGAATAGPLGQVVSGMREAASNDDRDHHESHREEPSYPRYEDQGYEVRGPAYLVAGEEGGPPLEVGLDASVALAKITDSGTAFSAAAALRFGPIAVGGGLTSFFEQDGDDTTRLDLWRVGGGLRLLHDDDTALWLDLAIAGVHTQPELSMFGFAGAGRLEQRVTRHIAVTASVGTVALEHDVSALEVGVTARLYVLTLGYKLLDFNVGPPLHGPEVGISFSI